MINSFTSKYLYFYSGSIGNNSCLPSRCHPALGKDISLAIHRIKVRIHWEERDSDENFKNQSFLQMYRRMQPLPLQLYNSRGNKTGL